MYYETSDDMTLSAGLEDPTDTSRVIGKISIKNHAFCASSSNRRRWKDHHHIIDANTKVHPEEIIATWVLSEKTVEADALATCLFFIDIDQLRTHFTFDYCILTKDHEAISSTGFNAELYS
ncbi:MAG: ApbE family protein [Microgenomates bacterium OLB22]|nr:MAG: ApbE family protein [Microgenomates bacterium OLB22]